MQDTIRINAKDTVAVALKPIPEGTHLTGPDFDVVTVTEIPQGHKFAIRPMKAGEEVIKYG